MIKVWKLRWLWSHCKCAVFEEDAEQVDVWTLWTTLITARCCSAHCAPTQFLYFQAWSCCENNQVHADSRKGSPPRPSASLATGPPTGRTKQQLTITCFGDACSNCREHDVIDVHIVLTLHSPPIHSARLEVLKMYASICLLQPLAHHYWLCQTAAGEDQRLHSACCCPHCLH